MQSISPEALFLVTDQAPAFIKLVNRMAHRKTRRLLHIPMDTFDDNPFLMYACVWYAQSLDVDVQFSARLLGERLSLR
jgi:hypothetical protein